MRLSPTLVATLAFLLTILAAAPVAAAGMTTRRIYAVPGRPSLQLDVPIRWREQVRWDPEDGHPTLVFAPDRGEDLAVSVTVLWDPAGDPLFNAAGRLRALVEESGRAALPAGTEVTVEEIGGRAGLGFFYSVADPTVPEPPPPGAFRVLTQGAVGVADYLLSATILTQDAAAPDLHDALQVLRTAAVTTDAPDSWRMPAAPGDTRRLPGLGRTFDVEVPSGVEIRRRDPLWLVDPATLATLSVIVEANDGDARAAAARLEALQDRATPDGWVLRGRGTVEVGGVRGQELILADEHHRQLVHHVVLPSSGATLTATWRVPSDRAREAEPLRRRIVDTLALLAPEASEAGPTVSPSR